MESERHGTHGMTSLEFLGHLDLQFAGLQRSSVTLDLRGCALSCASASAMQRRVWRFPTSAVRVPEFPSRSFISQQNLISHFQPQASSHCAKMLGMKSQVLGPCSGQALPPTWPQPQFNVCNRAGPWCLDMPCAIKKGTWALCKTEVWRDRHNLRPSQGVLDWQLCTILKILVSCSTAWSAALRYTSYSNHSTFLHTKRPVAGLGVTFAWHTGATWIRKISWICLKTIYTLRTITRRVSRDGDGRIQNKPHQVLQRSVPSA